MLENAQTYITIYLSILLSIYHSVYHSVYCSIYISIYHCIYLSINQSILYCHRPRSCVILVENNLLNVTCKRLNCTVNALEKLEKHVDCLVEKLKIVTQTVYPKCAYLIHTVLYNWIGNYSSSWSPTTEVLHDAVNISLLTFMWKFLLITHATSSLKSILATYVEKVLMSAVWPDA